MKLKEFIEKGYTINAQVKVISTQEVNLNLLQDGTEIDECHEMGDEIDIQYDDSNNEMISYDIIDPDGNLISGYKPTLFNDEEVRAFIAKL